MQISTTPQTKQVFDNYPKEVQAQMLHLRKLVLEVAENIQGLEKLEETLKWGEPAYITKHGSTLRMDWKAKNPDQYAMYFQCTSQLVPTFRFLYPEKLKFEGNRAVVFDLKEEIPEKEVKHCISMALQYHKLKHLPMLGN
tara:strand:+ start:132 stop:551 length:420 start_codon:yes stop_codon:yes gene_type:complete